MGPCKMRLISHRGNINGAIPEMENNPVHIHSAISSGFDVELDVYLHKQKWYLGHDEPKYLINIKDYVQKNYWLHCKNSEAFEKLYNNFPDANCFWHENDRYTITSHGYIWCFPGVQNIKNSIVLFPKEKSDIIKAFGICADDFTEIRKWI